MILRVNFFHFLTTPQLHQIKKIPLRLLIFRQKSFKSCIPPFTTQQPILHDSQPKTQILNGL